MRNFIFSIMVLLLAGPAYGVVLPTADSAEPIKPQHIEATGFLTGGIGAWALGSTARIGVSKKLDFAVRLGALFLDRSNFQVKSDNSKEPAWHTGFEFSTGLRYKLLQWENIISVAVASDVALAKAADIIYYGFDPRITISHHRPTGKTTTMFFALSGGLTLTHKDSGRIPAPGLVVSDYEQVIEGDHTRVGPLFSLVVGYGLKANEFLVFDTTYRSNELQVSLGMGKDF